MPAGACAYSQHGPWTNHFCSVSYTHAQIVHGELLSFQHMPSSTAAYRSHMLCPKVLAEKRNRFAGSLLGLGHSLGTQSEQTLLGLVELEGLRLTLGLQLLDGLLVLPADRSGQITQLAEAVPVLQAQHLQSVRHDHALHAVVGSRHTLEHLQALQSSVATLGLVGHHAAHSPPEDAGGSTEVEWATHGVGVHALAQEALVLHLLAHQATRH
mmetsp:Transcript_28490/g.72489  ORF Transcript_28490/g.72489 Transcript_28490/m.72489 type:complete len:212 (-) Transcript_28490:158-793(-)